MRVGHKEFHIVSIFCKPETRRLALRRTLAQAVGARKPVSNIHCANMVDVFVRKSGWSTLERCRVPGDGRDWHIQVVRP